MTNLQNQTILITGSTDGLGKLTAINLAKAGANIIVHGRSQTKIDATLNELKEINSTAIYDFILCDFNKPNEIAKSLEKINNLDILINNTGVWLEGDTINATLEKIIELVNVNLASYLLTTRILLPILLRSQFAQILNVVSTSGIEIPVGYYHTIYTATKYGLQGFSEAMEKEFENKNLRIMGFYPGGMETKLFDKAGMDYKKHEDWMFDPQESVDAIIFMLTRNKKVNIKRLDLINHLLG